MRQNQFDQVLNTDGLTGVVPGQSVDMGEIMAYERPDLDLGILVVLNPFACLILI